MGGTPGQTPIDQKRGETYRRGENSNYLPLTSNIATDALQKTISIQNRNISAGGCNHGRQPANHRNRTAGGNQNVRRCVPKKMPRTKREAVNALGAGRLRSESEKDMEKTRGSSQTDKRQHQTIRQKRPRIGKPKNAIPSHATVSRGKNARWRWGRDRSGPALKRDSMGRNRTKSPQSQKLSRLHKARGISSTRIIKSHSICDVYARRG